MELMFFYLKLALQLYLQLLKWLCQLPGHSCWKPSSHLTESSASDPIESTSLILLAFSLPSHFELVPSFSWAAAEASYLVS